MRAKRSLIPLALLPFGMILVCSCSAPYTGTAENSAVIKQGLAGIDNPMSAISATPKASIPMTVAKSDIAYLESSLNQSLESLASSVGYPSSTQIVDAVKKVTSDSQFVEISPVETPTGLRADSIQVAFAFDSKECIFGYIRGQDVSTSILPILSNGKCMVGATS